MKIEHLVTIYFAINFFTSLKSVFSDNLDKMAYLVGYVSYQHLDLKDHVDVDLFL